MKILLAITRSDTIGGAQTHVLDLAIALSDSGWNVLVIVGGHGGELKKRLTSNNIKCTNITNLKREPGIHDIFALASLRKHILEFKPDIISLHSVKAGLLGRLAAISTGGLAIYTAHGWSHIRAGGRFSSAIYAFIERKLAKLSASIICVCDNDVSYAVNRIGIDNNIVVRIYNGVRDHGKTCFDKSRHETKTTFFGIVARFSNPKDNSTIIDALHSAAELDWKAEFVGDGDQLDELITRAASLGMEDKISFAGFVRNVDDYYQKFDYLILSSFSEGLPCSIAEGFAWRIPSIASDVGGISEMITDGYNGWLVSEQTPDAFEAAIREAILQPPNTRSCFSENSRETYENKFSLASMIEKTSALYMNLLENNLARESTNV